MLKDLLGNRVENESEETRLEGQLRSCCFQVRENDEALYLKVAMEMKKRGVMDLGYIKEMYLVEQ